MYAGGVCRLMSSLKTDKEIEDLLNHKNNSLNKVKIKVIGKGNHGNQGNVNGTPNDRNKDNHATVAVISELIGGKGAASLFNMSESTVSNYRNGKNAAGAVDAVLQDKVESKLNKINEKIVDKVDQLLEIFAEEKMEELKAGEIPSSIEKLINTHDKVNRRHEKMPETNRPQVLLWAPKQINIENYVSQEVE